MADVTADLIVVSMQDGYQNGLEDIYDVTQQFPLGITSSQSVFTSISLLIPTIRDTVPGPATTTYFFMRARDPDCAPSPPTYRYWVVTTVADANAAHYSGARCGGSALTDIVVERTWTVTN